MLTHLSQTLLSVLSADATGLDGGHDFFLGTCEFLAGLAGPFLLLGLLGLGHALT